MNDVRVHSLFAIRQPPCHVISLLGIGSISFGMLCLCSSRQASVRQCSPARLADWSERRQLLFSSLTSSLNGEGGRGHSSSYSEWPQSALNPSANAAALCTMQVALLFMVLAIAFFWCHNQIKLSATVMKAILGCLHSAAESSGLCLRLISTLMEGLGLCCFHKT